MVKLIPMGDFEKEEEFAISDVKYISATDSTITIEMSHRDYLHVVELMTWIHNQPDAWVRGHYVIPEEGIKNYMRGADGRWFDVNTVARKKAGRK